MTSASRLPIPWPVSLCVLLLLVLAAACDEKPVGPAPNPIEPVWTFEAPLPTDEILYGVWGTSASNVYAVGGGGEIIHYDGAAWDRMDSPTEETLSAVWGRAADGVYAVGDHVVLHYDGTVWSLVETGVSEFWYGVWGAETGEIFVVGEGFLHFDGAAWEPLTDVPIDRAEGVWGRSSDDVYAAGTAGAVSRFDGSIWTLMDRCSS